MEKLNDKIKKNLLDLEHNKHLQYYNTSIIILFTYVVGIIIAFLTKQIDYTNLNQLYLTAFISAFIIALIVLLMFQFRVRLENIIKKVKKLRI